MTGSLFCADGKTLHLPELTQWEILRTDGDGADAFRLQVPLQSGAVEPLRRAVRLTLREASTIRFSGLVDEVECTVDAEGMVASVIGRGLAARLLDNEVDGAEFRSVGIEDILARYCTPYGIVAVDRDAAMPRLQLFAVPTGCSCHQALWGFCRHAAGIRPRFLADGTLQLRAVPDRARHAIGPDSAVLRAEWRLCRYGVRTKQTVHDLTGRVSRTADNPALLALGGRSEGVATRSGPYCKATEQTAAQRIRAGNRTLQTLELTLPGSFLAEPRDAVAVTLPQWGMEGDYFVQQVRSCCGPAGLRCTLTLGTEE